MIERIVEPRDHLAQLLGRRPAGPRRCRLPRRRCTLVATGATSSGPAPTSPRRLRSPTAPGRSARSRRPGTSIESDKPRTVRSGSTCEYKAMSAFRLASLSSSGHGPRQPSRVIVSLIAAIVRRRAKLIAMDRIVVVGASLAGLRACESLRRGGYAGTITLIGAERTSALRPAAAQQGVVEGRLGAGTHPAAQAGRARRPRSRPAARAPSPSRSTSPNRSVDAGHRRSGRRRRRDHRHRQRAAAACRTSPTLDGVTMLRTLDDSLALRRRLAKLGHGRRDRRRVHRPRGCRHRGADADARSRCSRGPRRR